MTICPFKQSIPTGDPIPEPARIAYTIENNSGVSLGMAIKKSGVSAGPCNHAENASGLRLFDEGLAIQLRRNNSFQITMENSNTCRPSDVQEMTKAPVNITVTVNSGDSFLAVPLYADGLVTVRGELARCAICSSIH